MNLPAQEQTKTGPEDRESSSRRVLLTMQLAALREAIQSHSKSRSAAVDVLLQLSHPHQTSQTGPLVGTRWIPLFSCRSVSPSQLHAISSSRGC